MDPFKYYRRSIHDLLGIVRTAIANKINRRPDAEQWQAVEDAAIDSMSWADILAAGALRWRGLRQTIVIPVEEPTWEQVADSNWWAKQQSIRAAARIAEEAERFANRTKQYVDKRMQSEGISPAISRRYREAEQARLADEALARRSLNRTRIFVPQRTGVIAPEQRLITPDMIRKAEHKPVELSAIPEYAVRRFERDSVGTIANDAEQLAMNDPEVGDAFLFTRYLTRDDSRVRPTHRAMQNLVAQRAWDGWRTVRPLNGFNCFLPGTRTSGAFSAGVVARYNGPAVELQTLRGHRLSVTVNHPIFTPNGWVPAGLINEGQYVLANRIGVVGNSRDKPDNENGPSLIEDVVESLRINTARSIMAMSIKVSPLDLYGDGAFIKGKINVVGSYISLLGEPHAKTLQDNGLVSTNPPKRFESTLGASARLFKSLNPSLGSPPGAAALPLDLGRVFLDSRPFDFLRIGPAANWNIFAPKEIDQGSPSYSHFIRDLLAASSGQISLDQIVSVRKFDYSGHVYDLESKTGWLLSGGIVTSNCRCYIRHLTRFEARDLGYLSSNGFARFMVRWPNTMAERNFTGGIFPDAGWKGPKFVASAAPIPIERVA